jgi:hypothetical protein
MKFVCGLSLATTASSTDKTDKNWQNWQKLTKLTKTDKTDKNWQNWQNWQKLHQASSNKDYKIGRDEITEILLKKALNTINQTIIRHTILFFNFIITS